MKLSEKGVDGGRYRYSSMHEKILPNRPCRYRVGVHRSALAGPRKRRATSPSQLARDPRRHLLRLEERLPLAAFAPRLPALADRLPLLQGLASGRGLGEGACRAAQTGAGSPREGPPT